MALAEAYAMTQMQPCVSLPKGIDHTVGAEWW